MELSKEQKIILLRVYVRKVCYPGEIDFIPRSKMGLARLDQLKNELRAEREADPKRFCAPIDPARLEPKEVHLNTSQLRLIKRALKDGCINDASKWKWIPYNIRGMAKSVFLEMLEDCEND